MGSSPILSRENRIALLVFLIISILFHIAMIPFRIYFTVDSWYILGAYRNSRYGRNDMRGRPYQVATIIIETLLLPVALFQLWTLWKRRLTYAAFLAYSIGWTVYWTVILGVTIALMTDATEALTYYLIYYLIVIACIMGLYVIQMFWAIGVFFASRKERKTAETIPGGAAGARGSYDVYLENMSADERGKKSTSSEA
ncbi:Hypothetical protein D9617_1g084730 [Elsinoe fawcettii]|nr:Hypothetical protein D9617_1g084730 [Elsinoe fawcettii]